jgi:subtilisin-like proprotein convertase family protein/subtilisin family serine protease
MRTTIWIRKSPFALAALVASIALWAHAQTPKQFDKADQVLHGPKAARRIGADPNSPKDTDEYIVQLKPGADYNEFASRHGLNAKARLATDANWLIFKGRDGEQIAQELKDDPDVALAGPNQITAYKRFGFTPNDPYFSPNNPSPGWQGQWHLLNQIGGTVDADVKPAWDANWTGSGVVIGIVDDCLQKSHPDLSPNFSSSNSWNFGNNTADPSPVYATDMHGTSVSGVAAARGGNGIGGTGAAPFSKLAGLRIDFNTQTTQEFVDATLFHSSGSNTAIKVENHSYGYTSPFVATDLERQALATSAAAGTTHVFAAGNERGNAAQDSNTLDLQSSSDSITVAALGEDGKYASYSSFGSNIFVCAPSNSDGLPAITTTDVTGSNGYNPSDDTFSDQNYTTIFGGTSSAAPLVTGVLALAKQANPAMDERLAKHLLVRSAKIVDPTDSTSASGGGWNRNGAGFSFNENYGFGCIDAGQLVQEAQMFQGVTKLQTEVDGPFTVNLAIPDNNPTGRSAFFPVTSTTPLEEVLLNVNVTHPYRGDLEIWLHSPMGTWSRLKSTALGATATTSDSGANIHWTFSSNAFWGEIPSGTWTVVVKDLAGGDTGTLNDFTFTALMGVPILKDNAKFITQTVPTTMVAGQTYPVTLQFLNNGYSCWNHTAWYLRAENPSANTTWGASTVSLASTDNIAPTFSKTFSFKIYAPTAAGAYNFQWRMHHSGFMGFGDYSTNIPITVTLMPDAARFMSTSTLPNSVVAGSTFPVTVTMRNVGSNSWLGGAAYNLKAVTSSTKWANPNIFLQPSDNIPQGATKTFTFTATAPSTPGSYVMQYQMANGTTAFGDRTASKTIQVTSS